MQEEKRIPVSHGNFISLEDCPGETLYKSPGTGSFGLTEGNFFKNYNKTVMQVCPYQDPTIIIKKISKPYVTNQNLILIQNLRLISDSGYHLFPPQMDPRKYGKEVHRLIRGTLGKYHCDYLVSDEVIHKDTGFYVGNTDNFGHWLFEFLPKALWYKRLFPNQEIPLLVGESVPEKWFELFDPFGIDKSKIERFPAGATILFNELILCNASCKREESGEVAIRLQDFYDIKISTENHFKHISIQENTIDCLYCSRKNARWRRTTNEDEVVSWLSSNFKTEIFEPENLSIKQQLNMLGRTKFFFGAGASIPFSMFLPKDSVFFEIRPPQGHGVVGRCWADMFKFGYHRIATEWNEGDIKLPNFHEQDLSIKMDHLINDVSKIAEITQLIKKK